MSGSIEIENRACLARVKTLASRWARTPGVLRVRSTLFDVPDMEAERKVGYPVKTHPLERQYQAWIDLVVAEEDVVLALPFTSEGIEAGTHLASIHVYPVRVVYTSVYAGRPTLVGLRGYAAYEAIRALEAAHQREPALFEWMYGPVVQGRPARETA